MKTYHKGWNQYTYFVTLLVVVDQDLQSSLGCPLVQGASRCAGLSSSLCWSRIELVSAEQYCWYPGILGWSGIFWRCLSNCFLNSSVVHLVMFRRCFGSALKILQPFTDKLPWISLYFAWGTGFYVTLWAILQRRPFLELIWEQFFVIWLCSVKSGTWCSNIRQIYMAMYLSRRRSWEYRPRFCNCSQ